MVDTGQAKGLASLVLDPEYQSTDQTIIAELYAPCLRQATAYDRAVGYFRANILRELSEPLLDFVLRGGRMRLVCSPDVPAPDENAARTGYDNRGQRPEAEVAADLTAVLESMASNPAETDCLSMLRLLIEQGALDLFIAVRTGGIYHRKLGVFSDDTNAVAFSGSANETIPGLVAGIDYGNDEEIEVYRSWGELFEQRKVARKREYLDQLFVGGTGGTTVRRLNQTERDVLAKFRANQDLEQCRPGARARTPAKETPIQLYSFQEDAIRAWNQAGNGILAMATGLGKTITAIHAIQPWLKKGNPCLIVVPSSLLLEQWLENCQRFLPDVAILPAGGKYNWKADTTKRMYVRPSKLPRLVVATMQTACSPDFLEFFQQANDAVLVADEVHRLGALTHRRILTLSFTTRLGLSATPERLFDFEGNQALEQAFGAQPVYSLGLGDKVRLRRDNPHEVPVLGYFLCPYQYFFHEVHLTSAEQDDWNKITDQIRLASGKAHNAKPDNPVHDQLQRLLIQRARICKQANEKPRAATAILRQHYRPESRWIVYCDDIPQMDATADQVRRAMPHANIMAFHSQLPRLDRERILKTFTDEPGIIVSIRCLDEGVDIPRADGALILASSTNPREYIQRRGRVLRQAHGKQRAIIVDALVLPAASEDSAAADSILRSELARAYEFSRHSVNADISHDLWRLCQRYGLHDTVDSSLGLEEETNDGE